MREPGLRRGSVWIADLPEPVGRRPVVVLTRDVAIPYLTSVTVAIVTRTVRGIPSEVTLAPEEGLRHECVANCDNLHTVPIRWLDHRVGVLGPDRIDALARAVQTALDV